MYSQKNTQNNCCMFSDSNQKRTLPRHSAASSSNIGIMGGVNIPATVFSRSPFKSRDILKNNPTPFNIVQNARNDNNLRNGDPLRQIVQSINTPNRYTKASQSPFCGRQTNLSVKKGRPSAGQGVLLQHKLQGYAQNYKFHESSLQNQSQIENLSQAPTYAINSANLLKTQYLISSDCSNHPTKPAKYAVQSDQQTLHYCQKCAILLASQGFKVCKLAPPSDCGQPGQLLCIKNYPKSPHRSPMHIKSRLQRISEVNAFLHQLSCLSYAAQSKKEIFLTHLNNSTLQLSDALQKLQRYYEQFHQTLDKHKEEVVRTIKSNYEENTNPITHFLESQIKTVMKEVDYMITDIKVSLDTVIPEADESQYKAVMGLYRSKLRSFESIVASGLQQPQGYEKGDPNKVNFGNLEFEDPGQVIRGLKEGLAHCVRYVIEGKSELVKQCSINIPTEQQIVDSDDRETTKSSSRSLRSPSLPLFKKITPGLCYPDKLRTSHSREQIIEQQEQENLILNTKTQSIELNKSSFQDTNKQQTGRKLRIDPTSTENQESYTLNNGINGSTTLKQLNNLFSSFEDYE